MDIWPAVRCCAKSDFSSNASCRRSTPRFPETALEDGLLIAEEIRNAIASTTFLDREWALNNPPLHLGGLLSASIGIAEHLPSTDASVSVEQEKSDLLRRADSAMYRAKSLGKNQVVVSKTGEELPRAVR